VTFNRAFAAAGLDSRRRRFSTLIDENTLAGSGADGTSGICAAARYFETLATPESLDFGLRYTQSFGSERRPLTVSASPATRASSCFRRSPCAPEAWRY
jgi:hypothetical protein